MERARGNAGTVLSASYAALIAREDTVQAKAALLPSANWNNGFIYSQPNGTDTGVFIAANAPREYLNHASVHGDIYAPGKMADYRRASAAEVVARAKADIAVRGLFATVMQGFYGLVAASRKYTNAQQSQREAEQFLDITQKLEQGGEVAHSDVVTAQILVEQRRRDTEDALVAEQKARYGLSVLVFPDFRQDYTAVDDLAMAPVLPDFQRVQSLSTTNNPDLRAAQASVREQAFEIDVNRRAFYPTLSFDYSFGLDSDRYAIHNRDGKNNIGSLAQATLNIPLWTWGATRSKVRQAELKLEQARAELTLAQRQLVANLNSYYVEADVASMQIASLRRSLDLSQESLRLTLLRYQAGEVTVLEVKDAQTTLTQSRNALDDGLVRYRVAVGNLQTLTGAF